MANQRLNATVTIGGALSKSVGRAIGGLRGGLKDVASEIKSVTARQKELSKQRKVLERQGQSVEALDREYEDLGRTLDRLRQKQERYERAVAASARVGKDFRGAVGEIGRSARNVGIAVGVAAGAVFGLASSTAELGDQVAKNADKFGLGIEAYQELRYAAERSGVSISTFDSSMTAFVKRLGEAKDGSGPAADALKSLGLNVKDIIKLAPDEALAKISDELEKVENPAERAAIMSDLFSRAGVGMVNMLRMGSENLQQLRRDAQATGYVLSTKAARDAETFQDRLLDAQLTVKGLKNVIGAEFMPVVTQAMERFSQWARTNRDDIEAFAEAAVDKLERLVPIAGEIVTGMTQVGEKIGIVVSKVAELVGGWENLGIVIGAALGAKVAIKIGALVFSVGRLAAAVLGLVGVTGIAGRAFGTLRTKIVADVGAAAAATEAAGARMRRALNISAALLAVQTGLAALQIPDDPDEVAAMMKRNRERTEEGLRNAPIIGGAMRAYEGARDWWHGKGDEDSDVPPELQRRERGGPFRRGWRLVGEGGPELEFMSRSGFIATARETRGLAAFAERARSALQGAADLPGMMGGAARAAAGASRALAPVTQNITIQADGMSVQQLVAELERYRADAAGAGLYDGVTDFGQYGRGFA
ncbi:hypothetical protein [Limimaricola cinnabarinus]|uniref:hypothetical protein n=1 Tax=Limimaricola cinnabarinus TaxID=1125964 RepID=UPI002FE40B46